jgi:ketosteroid isomerase-like protein
MSEENVEILRRAFAAFASGGLNAVLPFCSPEIVIYTLPDWIEEPVYRGHDGFCELVERWTEDFDDFELQVDELRDAGDGVVVWLGYNTGRIKGTKVPINQPVGGVQRFRDGLMVEIHYFPTWPEALEAAGLRE